MRLSTLKQKSRMSEAYGHKPSRKHEESRGPKHLLQLIRLRTTSTPWSRKRAQRLGLRVESFGFGLLGSRVTEIERLQLSTSN